MAQTITYYVRYRALGEELWISYGQPVDELSIILSGLEPNTTYELEVVAVNSLGQTTSTIETFTTAAQGPAPPTNLSASSLTANSLVLNWLPSSSGSLPIIYQVYYRVHGSSAFVTLGERTGANSSTISNLSGSTTYDFMVGSTNTVGSSTSEILTVTTAPSNIVPTAPSNLRVTGIGPTQVTLSWNASTGAPPISYQVRYRVSGTTPWTVGSLTSGLSAPITGLIGGTDYDFSVVASNPAGSTTSATITARTTPPIVAPSAPGTPTVSKIGSTALTLNWTGSATGSAPIAYQVRYRLHGQTNFANFSSPTPALTTDVIGLAAATSYDFAITASNSAGSSTSGIATATTQAANIPPTPPTGLSASGVAQTSLLLSWLASDTGTPPILYQPQRAVHLTEAYTDIGSPTSGLSVPVTGLTASTAYDFRIVASNAMGSATSAVFTTTTASAGNAPSAPGSLAASAATGSSITIAWTASNGTTPINYQPQYRLLGTATWISAAATVNLTTTISGLAVQTSYDFQVVATNSVGSATSAILTASTTLLESPDNTSLTTAAGTIVDHSLGQWRLTPTPTGGATGDRFTDDFNSLAATKWAYNNLDGGGDVFLTNDVTLTPSVYAYSGGRLNLSLLATPPGHGIAKPYISGRQDTFSASGAFAQQYGYFEIVVSVDRLAGLLFECIALTSVGGHTLPRFSICSIFTDSNNTMHAQSFAQGYSSIFYESTSLIGWDPTQLHSYGLNWTASIIEFYRDRFLVGNWNNPGLEYINGDALLIQTYLNSGLSIAPLNQAIINPILLPKAAHIDSFNVWAAKPF